MVPWHDHSSVGCPLNVIVYWLVLILVALSEAGLSATPLGEIIAFDTWGVAAGFIGALLGPEFPRAYHQLFRGVFIYNIQTTCQISILCNHHQCCMCKTFFFLFAVITTLILSYLGKDAQKGRNLEPVLIYSNVLFFHLSSLLRQWCIPNTMFFLVSKIYLFK